MLTLNCGEEKCVIFDDRHRIKFVKNCSNAMTVRRRVDRSLTVTIQQNWCTLNSVAETCSFKVQITVLKLSTRSTVPFLK